LVLSANLFADAVQNAFDPRARTLPTRIRASRRKRKKEPAADIAAAAGANDSFSR
jgi:peptide/nickel transport system permease protein